MVKHRYERVKGSLGDKVFFIPSTGTNLVHCSSYDDLSYGSLHPRFMTNQKQCLS